MAVVRAMAAPLVVLAAALVALLTAGPVEARIPLRLDALRGRYEALYGLPREYEVPMRDGTLLSTVVYLPGRNATGRFPAVIDRSPYGHRETELLALLFAPLGFAAVMQDLRGSGQSEGDFSFWRAEGADTYDTLAWIEQQEWSNGRVYQIGASADGLAALAGGLNEMPPQLKAQSVVWATGSVYQLAYQNGAWAEELFERWLNETGFPETIAEVQAQEAYSDWWDPIELSTKVGRCYYPSVFWGGWFDVCNDGTIEAWRFLQSNASGCGGQNTLFVDPHGHCGGMDAGESYFPLSRLALPLLQSFDLFTRLEADPLYRPGRAPRRGPEDADTVTFYVMGPGEEATVGNWWTTLPDFPTPAVVPYYCQPDGTLQRTPTTNTTTNFTYTYDPADPVPNLGGHNLYGECGQWDQRVNEARADVLSFTTDVLTEHTVVTGRVTATLFVSSSANDTDFTAQITDVHPDGRSMLVTQGIQRMRWRLSMTEPAYLTPDEVYEVIVDLWMTSYIFEAGHRIRLAVSSSNYPRFSANRNNGRLVAFEDTAPAVIARNTLHTTAAYPSRLNLPTVTLEQVPNNYKIRLDRPELAELARFLDIDVAVEL